MHDTKLEVWRLPTLGAPDKFMLVDPVRHWVINRNGWTAAIALRFAMQNYIAGYLEVLANPRDFPATVQGYSLRWQYVGRWAEMKPLPIIKHTIEEFMSHANPNNPATETIRVNSMVTESVRTVKVAVEKKVRDMTTISLTDDQVVLLAMLVGRCAGSSGLYDNLSETSAYKEALAATGHSPNVMATELLDFNSTIRPKHAAIAAIFNK